jgi:hypothetical protein
MLVATALWLGLLGVLTSPATASTQIVTDATDDNTGDPQPGQLRYEIQNAGPGDTIQIAPGVNPELKPPGAVAGGGQILIDKDLIIEGQGADQTTISVPTATSRIFMIPSTFPAHVVTIRDLTMRDGHAPDGAAGTGAAGANGGAIHNSGDLTLNRVDLVGNQAGDGGSGILGTNGNPAGGTGGTGGPGGSGGAVFNTVGGDVTVMNSILRFNDAGAGGEGGQGGNGGGMLPFAGNGGPGGIGRDGGAIQNTGDLTVTNSTFVENRSGQGGDGGDKGSIGGFGAGGDGGASGNGGAIHQGGAGSVAISNSTIYLNWAPAGGEAGTGAGPPPPPGDPGADGEGGGTYFHAMGPTATVANTIYSTNPAPINSNCGGGAPITAVGANIAFPVPGGCPASFLTGNPQLGNLGDNGGPTRTMALGPGSAALNTAGPIGPATDQRGVSRPQGPRCDIGAFELEQATIPGSTCAGPPASPLIPSATPLTTGSARKKCKKGRKLKKGKCVKKKRRK